MPRDHNFNCSHGETAPFFDPNNWKVDSNFNLDTPLIEIGVNFHVLQDDNGGNNFDHDTDMVHLQQIFDWAANILAHPSAPTNPVTSVCGPNCHVTDTRIRLVLKRIETYQDDILNMSVNSHAFEAAMLERDSNMINDLNVYWTNGSLSGPYENAGGQANHPVSMFGTQDNHHHQWILMFDSDTVSKVHEGHYARAITLAHEVGHSLDLLHTYYGGGASAICNVASLYYLDDIFGPPGLSICPHDPFNEPDSLWSCDAGIDAECTNNLMSGNVSSGYLSPKQIGQMHQALRTTSIREKINNCPYTPTPFEVDSDLIWDKDVFLFRDVVVKAGNTLTITCRLGLPEDGKLIVEQGATLIVDGGTITNSCRGKFWKGIQVWGNTAQHQYNVSGPVGQNYQGKAIFKNGALIENARNGVCNWKPGDYSATGGIIQAKGAIFINCRRAAEFIRYQNFWSGNNRDDHSHFYLTDFVIDDDYFGDFATDRPWAGVTLWKTDGVDFRGCNFINTSTVQNSEQRSRGIFSLDANYTVQHYCNDQYSNNCSTLTPTTFEGWNRGVHASEAASSRPIQVRNSQFQKNMVGIELENSEYSEIYKNYFWMGKHPFEDEGKWVSETQNHLGVFTNETNIFSVEENVFTEIIGAQYPTHGILVYNSGSFDNIIYRNYFNTLDIGADALQINRNTEIVGSIPQGYIGLQFQCNDNNFNDVDFQISRRNEPETYPKSGIRTNQGSYNPHMEAANTFSPPDSDPNNYRNLEVNSDYIYRYIYSTNPPAASEITPGTFTLMYTSNDNTCPSNFGGLGGTTPGGLPGLIQSALNEFSSVEYTYANLIDNGNTQATLNDIALTWPNDAWALRDELIARSPYNSEEVLIAAAQKEIMPHAMLLEVLLSNPDALQSGKIAEIVQYDLSNPMPQYMVDMLYEARDETTLRTSLESAMAHYHALASKYQKQIVSYKIFPTDSIGDADSLLYYMSRVKTPVADYARASAMLDMGLYTQALSLLDSVAIHYRLSQEQHAENQALQNFFGYLQTLAGQQKIIANLDSADLVTLIAFAEDPVGGKAAQKAQNILCFHYNICYQQQGQPKSNAPKVKKPAEQSETINKLNTSAAFPNPAKDFVTVEYKLLKASENTTLMIYDLKGHLVTVKDIGKSYAGQQLIDSRKYPDGTYFYTIEQNGKKISSGKFVTSK